MATFKIHIYKKINGKLLTRVAECGRGAFTPHGAPNVMLKSNSFKNVIIENGIDTVCSVCANRAKLQGRI